MHCQKAEWISNMQLQRTILGLSFNIFSIFLQSFNQVLCIDQVHKHLYFFFIVSYFMVYCLPFWSQIKEHQQNRDILIEDRPPGWTEWDSNKCNNNKPTVFILSRRKNKTFYHLKKTRKWTRQNIKILKRIIATSLIFVFISS